MTEMPGSRREAPERARNRITRRLVLAGAGGLAGIAALGPPAKGASQGKVTTMQITRAGSQPSGKGPAEWFTGTVRVDPLFTALPPARPLRSNLAPAPLGTRTRSGRP